MTYYDLAPRRGRRWGPGRGFEKFLGPFPSTLRTDATFRIRHYERRRGSSHTGLQQPCKGGCRKERGAFPHSCGSTSARISVFCRGWQARMDAEGRRWSRRHSVKFFSIYPLLNKILASLNIPGLIHLVWVSLSNQLIRMSTVVSKRIGLNTFVSSCYVATQDKYELGEVGFHARHRFVSPLTIT